MQKNLQELHSDVLPFYAVDLSILPAPTLLRQGFSM